MEKNSIHIRNLGIWTVDQLRHPRTLFQRKSWGVFSEYSHIRRSDRRPKQSLDTKEKALEVAAFMEKKYGGGYSVYKCLYCDGWHVAKDQPKLSLPSEAAEPSTSNAATNQAETISLPSNLQNPSTLDLDKLLKLNIPDIASVYGGIRGRTMSSRHQDFAWPIIKECGIRCIIDLRQDGVYTRLSDLCRRYGMDYFHYPVDTKTRDIEDMVRLFPELCERIDTGHFYIACAMGLHRTDIALCCYWVFHAADRGIEPPEIRGYRKATGHSIDKVMRVLNAFYRWATNKAGRQPIPPATFEERKKTIAMMASQ